MTICNVMRTINLKIKMLIATFLLVLMSWQLVFQLVYSIYWKINQTEITELFCENKDKPMLHCDGNCYLAKQIKKVENEKQQFPNALKKINFEYQYIFTTNNFNFHFDQNLTFLKSPQILFQNRYLVTDLILGIFHPPRK